MKLSHIEVDRVAQHILDEQIRIQRGEQAIAAFYEREGTTPVVSWKLALIGLFLGAATATGVVWWLVTLAVEAVRP